jgi:hypothetical protein
MTVRKIDDYLTFGIASEISNSSNKLQMWFRIFSFFKNLDVLNGEKPAKRGYFRGSEMQ